MSQGIRVLVYPVTDIDKAKTLFSKLLGVEPCVDQTYYVGFRVGELEVGLDPDGHDSGAKGPIVHGEVSDIRKSLQELLDTGAQAQQDVKDVGRQYPGLMQSP